MKVAGLKHVNGIVKDVIKRASSKMHLRPGKEGIDDSQVIKFTHARYTHRGEGKRIGKEGCIIRIAYRLRKGSIFHTLAWLSRKQRRGSTLGIQADAISGVTSLGYAIQSRIVLQDIAGKNLPITLLVDSLGLHKTLATQATWKGMSAMYEIHSLRLDLKVESSAC